MIRFNLDSIKRMPAGSIVILATGLSIAICCLFTGVAYLVWSQLKPTNPTVDMWAILEALATAAAFSVAVGGGLMVLAQLTEAVDSRNLTIFNDVFERLASDRNIDARRWIYQNLPDNPGQGLASLSEEGRQHVKYVLNSFDHLGFLIEQDWVSGEAEDAIVGWVSPFVTKTWEKLGPYVDYEVSQRPEEPDYYEAVRYLAEKCIAYRKKLLGRAPKTTWRDDAL